jgi:hypothetical protein
MSQLVRLLNENAGALSVLFSFVVMVATVVYAVLTLFLVRETSKLRKLETDPNISIYLEPQEQWISLMDLVIQNNGRAAAYEVHFKIYPDFECRAGQFLSSYPFMQVIRYLAPGQRFKFFLASAVEVLAREAGKSFTIEATYKSQAGKIYQEKFTLDFEHFRGMTNVGQSAAYKIADAIEKMQKNIDSAVSDKRLNIRVWTRKDLEKEAAELKRWRDETINKMKEGG